MQQGLKAFAARRDVAAGFAAAVEGWPAGRLALQHRALQREQQRRGQSGGPHDDLLPRLHLEAVVAQQRGVWQKIQVRCAEKLRSQA